MQIEAQLKREIEELFHGRNLVDVPTARSSIRV